MEHNFNSESLSKNNYLLSLLKMLKNLICDAPAQKKKKHKFAWKAIIYGPYFTLIKNLSSDYSDYSAIFSDIKACFSPRILIHYIIIIQSFRLSSGKIIIFRLCTGPPKKVLPGRCLLFKTG